jgi:hypothetical protein
MIQTIEIDNYMDGGFNAYDEIISDHLPVALMLAYDLDLIDNVMLPQNYYLTNYPNPFNPTTIISYKISEKGQVNVSIYNMNGQLIDQLVNQEMIPGSYSVTWNTSHVSSGLYFYKLAAGNQTITKKMLLLK